MWALSAIALAINDAGRRLVGRAFATKRRSATITIVPSRLVSSVKSVLKAYQWKTIFKEYFLNPKATAKVLEADGWLHTGDTGYRDEEGFFYFVDRRCNMIKRGGENVSCVELENIIATHPKIQDIVVVGIKDSIRDEAIKAFVVLNEGETLSEEEFFRFCEQNMAKFKVPSYLEIRKDLPRNCSGKIIRKNLK